MVVTPKTIVQSLQKRTPCDVSDALLKYGFKNGGYFPNLVQRSGINPEQSVVGPAYTVLYAPIDDPRPAVKGGYIDKVPKDHVIVIGLTENLQSLHYPFIKVNNGLYGGLMSTRAQYLGAAGTVVFGRIRDINEHRDLNYPVFSYAIGATAPSSGAKVVGINVPITVRLDGYPEPTTETINPSDYIIADENGVVRLPSSDQTLIEKVLEFIPKRVEADTLVAKDIKEGKPALESQKLRRGE